VNSSKGTWGSQLDKWKAIKKSIMEDGLASCHGYTFLHALAAAGKVAAIQNLLRLGADVNTQEIIAISQTVPFAPNLG
jgi:hypothetical protein